MLFTRQSKTDGFNSVFGRRKLAIILAMLVATMQRPVRAASARYRVSDNGHYLVEPGGEPFYWQGDTEWELFYLLTEQDAKDLLQAS
jgi:hypothetical protein